MSNGMAKDGDLLPKRMYALLRFSIIWLWQASRPGNCWHSLAAASGWAMMASSRTAAGNCSCSVVDKQGSSSTNRASADQKRRQSDDDSVGEANILWLALLVGDWLMTDDCSGWLFDRKRKES